MRRFGGAGIVAEVIVLSGEVLERQLPVMRKIKRRAIELAEAAGFQSEVDYMHGFLAGGRILEEIRQQLRKPKNKRETDDQKRQLVYLFGALCGTEIENVKSETSWPELTEAVSEMCDHQIEFDEDTTKKILQRVGLNGVGKAGRPLTKERLYMWTFTFKELLNIKDTRKHWNHLLTLLLREWPQLQGLRVFEMHKEHGLHVHLLTNRFIDVNAARACAEQAGWGRIHVTEMPPEHASYLAKYLSKKRPPCLKRWRLWDSFGEGWDPTKLKDLDRVTLFSRVYRACKELRGWTGKGHFMERMGFARRMVCLTIENGWEPGLGPSGKPYWMCSGDEFEVGDGGFEAPF